MAILPNGNILITDAAKACIHEFEEGGKYCGKFGNVTDFKSPAGKDHCRPFTHGVLPEISPKLVGIRWRDLNSKLVLIYHLKNPVVQGILYAAYTAC